MCDRCRHFVCRESGVSTCAPCRKAYQLLVSVRNVIPPGKDESAVVFLEGCFGLLQDWLEEIKGLTKRDRQAKEKPRDKPEEKEGKPTEPDSPRRVHRPAEPAKNPAKDQSDQPPPATSRPSSSSRVADKLPLPPPRPPSEAPQGSATRGHSSQTVRVPKPSHRDPDPPVERREKREAGSPKGKTAPQTREAKVEEDPEEPSCARKEKERKRRKRERSTSSPSSRRRDKKKRRRDQREKKDRGRRRRRSRSESSSVTGSRVREAKKTEAVRLKSPVRPPSPHTPPGPPPAPPPVRQPPVRPPPVRPPRRPAVPQGPGWIGRVPYSSHPRWWAGKNEGVTRRAKQELFNRRR